MFCFSVSLGSQNRVAHQRAPTFFAEPEISGFFAAQDALPIAFISVNIDFTNLILYQVFGLVDSFFIFRFDCRIQLVKIEFPLFLRSLHCGNGFLFLLSSRILYLPIYHHSGSSTESSVKMSLLESIETIFHAPLIRRIPIEAFMRASPFVVVTFSLTFITTPSFPLKR